MALFHKCRDALTLKKSINVINNINRLKETFCFDG